MGDDAAVAAIEATMRDYIEGWYNGDETRLGQALHPELVKRIPTFEDGKQPVLRTVTRDRMVELTREGGGGTPDAEHQVEVHHVQGGIATGLVMSVQYLDYVQLVKTPDGWQIVQILFRSRD